MAYEGYDLLPNWNLIRHRNSELAWTLNRNNTWTWRANFHPIRDGGRRG